jgi:hypothetical protein|tara:strand:- start:1279 stop:1647 length:369 start_codon:yes stop_codon:yes gene_type:complete
MIPYKLLFNIGSKAVGGFMQRRRDISAQKHTVALEEVRNGAIRAKRAGSLFLDLLLGAFILAPLSILAYASYFGDLAMYDRTKLFFDRLEDIPQLYLYLVFIVVGGNYGISVTNLLSGKKFK